MIMENKSCHGMESTSVLQATDQVGLWHIETKFHVLHANISTSTYIFQTQNIDKPENTSKKISSACPWVKVFSWKGIHFALDDLDLKHQYSRPLFERIPSSLLAEPRVCLVAAYSRMNFHYKPLSLVDKKNNNSPGYMNMMNEIIWKSSNTKNNYRTILIL